ncbi:MAG: RelA/SpoT family protein [Clostridiales bacterium]|jgi:GTP pyrophosphokinase|nr:RelA/SpoT family protein [Clostridiales bacterium]
MINTDNFLSRVRFAFPAEAAAQIEKALRYATDAHGAQRRDSGEPYIVHPVQVAEILLDLGMDADTICAALLHDTIEDTPTTREDIERNFNKTVAELVTGVTKLDKIVFKSKAQEQAENFRKMFFAMTKDIRVLIIKLADRLHNMRTLAALSWERQKAMAEETLGLYAPLASYIGLSFLKCELEDLCLKALHPFVYDNLVAEINEKRAERQNKVDRFIAEIAGLLDELGVKGEISGRQKHLYSIYRKMVEKNKSLNEIYDLTAIRVIADTVDHCYALIGKIHSVWRPIPGRIKDYIAVPKSNRYQSLHTTVMTGAGTPFEIQIRTQDMHRVAEYGIAAHWKYKEKRGAGDTDLDEKLKWLRRAADESGDLSDPEEFLRGFKIDLYGGQIFTFTPKGDVVILPKGSCPIDFAYKIHEAVGHKCAGAKVNGRIVSLDTKLATGDYVEILVNQNGKGPKRDWLNMAVTASAKAKIRAFFKREEGKAVKAPVSPIKRGGSPPDAPPKPVSTFIITAADSKGLLARVASVIGEDLKLSIKSIAAIEKSRQATITAGLEMRRGTDADVVIQKLKQIKGVKTVYIRR